MPVCVAAVAALIIWLCGGGDQNTNQKPPQCEHPCGSENATSVPTPALLPGLIGLGAAALRKRKSAIVTPED